MSESHRHLNITPKEWDAFMNDFEQTMDKFKVPGAERAELRGIVESTYDDKVMSRAWALKRWRLWKSARFSLSIR